MKLTVLVPSEDFRSTAGARIRYGRLTEGLERADVKVDLQSIADFDPANAECDAILISKCHDARSLVAAATMSARGKLVGVDLFDDYFSQVADSRLFRYREWLIQLLEDCDFCLCSTAEMATVVQAYGPELPTHVVNDPAREHLVDKALRLADSKIVQADRQNMIRAVWFGVGDNPYFPVGLMDLFAHSSMLTEFGRGGMAVQLTVLTNRRALGADGLEMLAHLPVPTTVMEWSEEVERNVLEESLLAFLPVASQSFSTAKSLNRAFTAFSFGCQVLSAGHPLYAALEPLVYRDSASLLADLARGRLRLSSEFADAYQQKLLGLGSAETESLRLATFLQGLPPKSAPGSPRLCVVHGLSTRAEIHHLTQSVDGFSVASPYCAANLEFDVFFRGLSPAITMTVSPPASQKALPGKAPKLGRNERVASAAISYHLATYAPSMRQIAKELTDAFGPIRLIVSETSRIPVSAFAES